MEKLRCPLVFTTKILTYIISRNYKVNFTDYEKREKTEHLILVKPP